MAFDINQVAINLQFNLADIAQFSTKTLEDYSIVSRKQLEKIVNDSERCLTEDEHRWLIKRDCKRVVSDIQKYTYSRRKSKNILREKRKEALGVKMPTNAIDQYVFKNGGLYGNSVVPECRNVLNIDSGISGAGGGGENCYNVVVENNFTVINVQQLNININNVGRNQMFSKYDHDDDDDDICETETRRNSTSEVIIMDLERIYWDKWRGYVREKKANRTNRCEKIDTFLMKIKEKLKADRPRRSRAPGRVVVPKQTKTISDRQQAKIDDQKKLLEKQQKEIERLKLQQLKLESEKAMLENQKLYRQTFDGSDKRLKIKNVPPSKSVVPLIASTSDILNRMEMRALDRRAKWEAIKERRRKKEQEELRKKQELEEKCLKEQMELKHKQLFEARESLRLKRIEECKRKMEREIWIENVKIAETFYRQLLMRRGLAGFKANLMNTKLQIEQASNYYDMKMLEVCFNKWRFFVNNNSNEKIFLAEQFYKQKLKKNAFLGFLKILEENKRKEQVAEDWHNFKTQEFWFKKWLEYIRELNIETDKKMLEVESYHNRIVIKRCFDNWRRFPEIVYKERLKDCRLRLWHEKVQEILPDFIPPEF